MKEASAYEDGSCFFCVIKYDAMSCASSGAEAQARHDRHVLHLQFVAVVRALAMLPGQRRKASLFWRNPPGQYLSFRTDSRDACAARAL